jgi:UDP-glucose 4-epimerase
VKVTVVGGRGFLGTPLSAALAAAGHTVTVFDAATSRADTKGSAGINFIAGDLFRQADVDRAIAGADVVVHLASATPPGSLAADPGLVIERNLTGSLGLFNRCAELGVAKIVFASSGGTVYGIAASVPIKESHVLNPINAYGLSKVLIEQCLAFYRRNRGVDHCILRIANPYGPRQRGGTGQGVIAAWADCVLRGDAVEIWGDGSVIRDYIHVDDVVRALVLAVERTSEQRVVNIGSGMGRSLLEIHALLETVVQREIPIVFRDSRVVDAPAIVLDVSLAEMTLGWRPEISLDRGLSLLWTNLIEVGNVKRSSAAASPFDEPPSVSGSSSPTGPLITVVTSALNARNRFKTTAASLRAQSYRNIQWIVIDGGSTDGTVDEIKRNEDIIDHWVTESDTGIYNAWNKACARIKGDWVLFIGAGDELASPGVMADVAPRLEAAADREIVYGRIQLVSDSGDVLYEIGEPWENIKGKWGGMLPQMPPHPSSFHHRSLFRDPEVFDESFRFAGDSAFVVRSVLRKDPLFIPILVDRMLAGGISVRPENILSVARERRRIAATLPQRPPFFHTLRWTAVTVLLVASHLLLPKSLRSRLREVARGRRSR